MEIKIVERKNKNCFQAEVRCGEQHPAEERFGVNELRSMCVLHLFCQPHIFTQHINMVIGPGCVTITHTVKEMSQYSPLELMKKGL
jgi:hypothetical protein